MQPKLIISFLRASSLLFVKNPLVAGSLVLFIGNMTANLGNYFYHLLMARMLGPASYGILESLISLLYLLGVPMATLNLVIVKFVSSFKGQKKFSAIKPLFGKFVEKFLFLGGGGLVIFLLFTSQIASFLHLESKFPLVIVGIIFFVGILITINRGFLQGLLRFGTLTISMVIESGLKFFLAVLFVWLGFSILGAILPLLMGGVIAYFFTLIFLKRTLGGLGEDGDFDYRSMVSYAFPVFLSILAFTSLYTTDIILARHFLSAQEAGFYAALSVLGKIIFFITGPIIIVMFPLISERHANGKQYEHLLYLSLGLVFFLCLGASLVYLVFPKLMVQTLFGSQYLAASPFLFPFALFLSFYSLAFLLTNFYLSIKEVKIAILPLIAALSQVIMIIIFHQTLAQIVWVSVVITALLLASQVIYYFYAKGRKTASFRYSARL